MAISGKRFQITDGASTPTNLFPYTVTEAVYGLSTVIANAISAFQQTLGSMAYETATNYLPLSAGSSYPLTGRLYIKSNNSIEFDDGSSNMNGLLTIGPTHLLQYYDTSDWRTIWHNGNSNKSDVDWTCKNVTFSNGYGKGIICEGDTSGVFLGGAKNGLGSTYKGGLLFAYGNNPIYFYTASAQRMIITGGGNVGIGTDSPACALDIFTSTNPSFRIKRSTSGSANMILFPDNQEVYGWIIGAQSNSTYSRRFSWYYRDTSDSEKMSLSTAGVLTTTGDQVISSDINLKTNLQPVTYSVEDIAKTRAVTFDWKDGRGKSAGSIAQDWKPLIPELVHGEEGNMTLAYGQIALVNSILLAKHETEQDKEIARLKARVKELETRLNIS